MERKYISHKSLMDLLTEIRKNDTFIYAPVSERDIVNFKRINSVDEITMIHIQTAQSAKSVAFPRTQRLV